MSLLGKADTSIQSRAAKHHHLSFLFRWGLHLYAQVVGLRGHLQSTLPVISAEPVAGVEDRQGHPLTVNYVSLRM